jgi:signal transduction histidine kinase
LDGNILETKLFSNSYALKDLTGGVHILRIIPVTSTGEIGRALVYSFSVVDGTYSNSTSAEGESRENNLQPTLIIYILTGIILILVIFNILLLMKRKGNQDDTKIKNQALQELSDLKHSYKRIIEEIKNYKEENDYLRTQIKQLDQNISMLEEANVHLIKQKEKLAESKRKLELLQTQKEELFAMAIHDIKNPASAIRSYIQLLNSYDFNAAEQQEIMASLISSSDNIVKVSSDMCEIIAKSMPEPKLSFSNSSLIKIVDNVCNQNISYAKTKSVKLLNKGSRDIPDLKIDSEKIEEALDNLVNNAIKYAPQGTIVEVYSYVKQNGGKNVIVEVQDNGVGLSDEDVGNVFRKASF